MPNQEDADQRYIAWFHELDAWTEYWDIYHPESRGRFYFGDGQSEPGLLKQFMPAAKKPPPFIAWSRMALGVETTRFAVEVRVPAVAEAIMEIDDLLGRLFTKHFGDAAVPEVKSDYLEGISRFATDTLPPAVERDARIAENDPRKKTAGRHTLDGDLMWFAWALQIEAAHVIRGADTGHPRRTLMLAGVATGCPADFSRRAHRRTRPEYNSAGATAALLKERSSLWASDFGAAADEVHALYRIREWGHE